MVAWLVSSRVYLHTSLLSKVKKKITLFTFSFLPFFLIGILAAGLFVKDQGSVRTVQAAGNQTSNQASQLTYLLIETDDMENPAPALKTINIAFVGYSDQTILKIMQIFPSSDSARDALLASQFSIVPGSKPAPTFLAILGTKFSFTWDGTLLYDRPAADEFSTWLFQKGLTLNASSNKAASNSTKTQLFQALCNVLQTHPKSVILEFHPSNLINKHFDSDINSKSFNALINKLSADLPFASCEIISEK